MVPTAARTIVEKAEGAHASALVAALCFAKGNLSVLSALEGIDAACWMEELSEAQRNEVMDAVRILASKPDQKRNWAEAELRALLKVVGGPRYADGQFDLYLQECGLPRVYDGTDVKRAEVPKSVAIVGAGMSGLLAAIKLIEQGHTVHVFEKNSDVGGTWFNNIYPGCRVDVHNLSYSYSFEQKTDWSENFSQQAEILDYFKGVVAQRDLRKLISFGNEVVGARWQEKDGCWEIDISDGNRERTERFDIVVFAVGQLNRPNLPDLPGRETFLGPQFHSAEWDTSVELRGRRIGVIGTGASAVQFVPELAKESASLTVFQRSAPWLIDTPEYHDVVSADHQWLMTNVPHYASLFRFSIFVQNADSLYELGKCDPNWKEPGSVNALNARVRASLVEHLAVQCGDDKDLLEQVTPSYAPGAKRFLRDNGTWINTLKQSHVAIEKCAINKVEPNGVRVADGTFHELDVIVYGTGFRASDFLETITITGRGGLHLHDLWQGDARAYLGICVPDFPNLFILYGPNTNIVANGSIIFFSECGVNFISEALTMMDEERARSFAVRRDTFDAFNGTVDEANSRMAWGAAGVDSWYKSASGRVSQNWPFLLVDYWRATRNLDRSLFVFDEISLSKESV